MKGKVETIIPSRTLSAWTTPGGCSGFPTKREATGAQGPTVFAVTRANDHLKVLSSSTVNSAGKLRVGSYSISGTAPDSSDYTGTWNSILTVTAPSKSTAASKLYLAHPAQVKLGAGRNLRGPRPFNVGLRTPHRYGQVLPGRNPGYWLPGCAARLGAANCSFNFAQVGTCTVNAVYTNDPNFAGSSDPSLQVVNKGDLTKDLTLALASPEGQSDVHRNCDAKFLRQCSPARWASTCPGRPNS